MPDDLLLLEAYKDQIMYSVNGYNIRKYKQFKFPDKQDIGAINDLAVLSDYIGFNKKVDQIEKNYNGKNDDLVELAQLEAKAMGVYFKKHLFDRISGGIKCFSDDVQAEFWKVAYGEKIEGPSAVQETFNKIKRGEPVEIRYFEMPDNLLIPPDFVEDITKVCKKDGN